MSSGDNSTETLSLSDSVPPQRTVSQRLVLAFEAEAPLMPPLVVGLADLDAVAIARGKARASQRSARLLNLEVADKGLSAPHARFLRQGERWVVEDQGSKNGTLVNDVAMARGLVDDGAVVQLARTFFLYREASLPFGLAAAIVEGESHRVEADALRTLVPWLGASFHALARAAGSGASMMLSGEPGTGKEFVARALHRLSGARGPFVAAKSCAISKLDDALREADGGTLFLDDIEELSAPARTALLRALEERKMRPPGGRPRAMFPVRFAAATHRSLDELEASGALSGELRACMSEVALTLPPLRDRREDLGLMVSSLLRRLAPAPQAVTFSSTAARALFAYRWPLNVRELEACLRDALGLAAGAPIGLKHLPASLHTAIIERAGDASVREAGGSINPPARSGSSPAHVARIESKLASQDVVVALERAGEHWTLAYEGRSRVLKARRGLEHLASLLSAPGREVHVLELAVGTLEKPWADGREGGEAILDSKAKDAYRARIAALREDEADADASGDAGRAARIRTEIEEIAQELTRALGLGRRDRTTATAGDRARAAVTLAIRRAIEAIARVEPVLGAHLEISVKTGFFCSYRADPSARIVWRVTT